MRLSLLPLPFALFLLTVLPLPASEFPTEAQAISSFWKRDLHLVDKAGDATTDPTATGWIIEPIEGQEAVRLRSNRSTSGYLTLKDGQPAVLPSLPTDTASWWVVEAVPNTPSYRIRTALDDSLYLNIEQGPLAVSDIHFGAWSGWWLLSAQPVAEEPTADGISKWPTEPQALQNFWKRDLHLSFEDGATSATPDATGWIIEPVEGQGAIRLRSDRGGRGYLMLDNGQVETVPTSPSDMVAWWVPEHITNTDAFRFRHFLYKDRYLNIEQGPLLTSSIHSGAWSSWWLFQAAPPVPTDATRSSGEKPTSTEATVLQMFGMWEAELPILHQAAKTKLGETSDQVDIAVLFERVANDSAARIAFMPFLVEAGYLALETETPDAAQAAFRERFRWYFAREQQRKAQGTLIHWLDYTKQQYQGVLSAMPNPAVRTATADGISVPGAASTEASSALTSIAEPDVAALVDGQAGAQELLIVIDTTTPIGDSEPHKLPTLGVLIDTGPKLSNFRPNEDNPLLLGTRGLEALGLLLGPTMLRHEASTLDIHSLDDVELTSAVERPTILEQVLTRLGFGAGAGVTVATLGGGPALKTKFDIDKLAKTVGEQIRQNDIAGATTDYEKQLKAALEEAKAAAKNAQNEFDAASDAAKAAAKERLDKAEALLARRTAKFQKVIGQYSVDNAAQVRPLGKIKVGIVKKAELLSKPGAELAQQAAEEGAEKAAKILAGTLGKAVSRITTTVLTMIPAFVDAAMAIAEVIETENFDRALKIKAMGPLTLPDLDMLLRPSHQYDAGLCYNWCAGEGESAFGTECLAACPEPHVDPGNARSCGPIAKPSYGRGVGTAMICPPGTDADGALCYEQCREGFDGVGPACWQNCPAGFKDDGAICRVDVEIQTKASYNRGAGTPLVCPQGTEQGGALCYPRCREGFNGIGPVCWGPSAQSYGRGGGVPLSACRPGEERNGALCYPKCSIGFEGNGPLCWASCPKGFVDEGLTCRKPEQLVAKASYGRGAGKPVTACPEGKVAHNGACYEPCRPGTTGVGTVCWGSCPDGYADAGGICHIDLVARVSRSRGAGQAPGNVAQCVSIEDRNLNRLTIFAYVAKMMIGDPADAGALKF